jgi:TonB-dependent receptor
MVLLNGRQMPTSSLGDQNGRAFDFSNLASESISQIQVYKSSRADTPPGGIGATINVMTARPFDNPTRQASVGIKAVYDTSNDNLPALDAAGSSLTPEVSGIYSNVFGNGMWGIAVSGSYQKRNLGVNDAQVKDGWRGPFRGNENNWGTIPQPGAAGAERITNRPDAGDTYSVPQNIAYGMRGTQRTRVNGQVTLQFRPIKDLTSTLDYTYSQNRQHTRFHEMTAWFNFGPSTSTWLDGPIAAPTVYSEDVRNQDLVMNGGDSATRSTNHSIGLNTQWKASPALRLNLDVHHSSAESKPDSRFGSGNLLGTASFSRNRTTGIFTSPMPILQVEGVDIARAPFQVTGSLFQHGYQKMEIDQIQAGGRLSLFENSSLNFGLGFTDMKNRTAFQQVQRDTWTGATRPEDYPAGAFQHDTLSQYFDKLGGHDNPALFNHIWTYDFDTIRTAASNASGLPAKYLPAFDDPDYDRRTREKNKSLHLQFNTEWDTALPIHTGIGVRVEKTDVVSTALSPVPTQLNWVAQNELPVVFGSKVFTTLRGNYTNVLPNLDFDIDLRSDLKLRASYGTTIGRPRFDQIEGGQSIGATGNVVGISGARGNPALKPVKAKSLDLSAEWYYARQSVASVGLFYKDLSNYAGQVVNNEKVDSLRTPVGGAYWNAALASGCINTDTTCIRNFIFRNFNGRPGVQRGPDNPAGDATGTISGQPGDPAANFAVTTFINEKTANQKGAEFNIQHMFGASGFGIQANYTLVRSNLAFDNAGSGNQFALVGLSDSANLVGIFENDSWTVRAAYNWRDKFLSSVTHAGLPNPRYTEAYGQLDLSVGYNWTRNLSLQFEAINLTDETTRVHGRLDSMVLTAAQGGPRYMLAARYKF